ncbi:right-handed parallel beta-helix repeat-containing protein, partial [bacterium]|nr:right-handed parallel beta-helix repeat-containing protein [bacterium]
ILLDKQIVLTCDNPHSAIGYPVITTSFVSEQEIIRITPAGSGTVIRNLEIWGPNSDNTTCSNYPIDHFLEKAGIRIEADDCCIENCRIIRCMTGIIIGDQSHNTGQGNSISGCKIGDRFVQGLETEEYWTTDPLSTGEIYPGNGFGIVAVEPGWSAPTSGYESIIPTEIVDCEIRSNRYYGVVLTNASKAQVNHNIIAFNGDWSISISDTIPDKSGGILSLFTAAQIDDPTNDNELQSPMIRSNNIYGNKGYQIGVFTGHDSYRTMYNSPVIMSNNIGTEENMPPITSLDQYNFLICCGPTPLFTATPAPTVTPTGMYQPDPTATSAPPGSFSYNYHGSGPIFAWNNYNDITYKGVRGMYHPMQKKTVPDSVVFSPTPDPFTPTPSPPPTSYPSTPTGLPVGATPTGIPWTPAPTPASTYTPAPGFYKISSHSWEILGQKGDPCFVGWVTPTPEGPPRFDWHLRDHDMSPTPQHVASNSFNHGGFKLSPGSTMSTMWPDTGFVDMGRHISEIMPTVENLSVTYRQFDLILTWNIPSHYPDGSILDPYDVGGNIVYWGEEEQVSQGGFGIKTPITQITIIGNPIYLDGLTTMYEPEQVPSNATHMGVNIYSVLGTESGLVWAEIPAVP